MTTLTPAACFEATMPSFVHGLKTLRSILEKGETFAKEQRLEEKALLEARLAPDMFELVKQVGYAYFTALEAAELLAGKAQPEMSYAETSFAELYASIDAAVSHLSAISEQDLETTDARTVETFLLPGTQVPVDVYVKCFALPNFYFHITTAYDILRHKGVPLKKEDYIGAAHE